MAQTGYKEKVTDDQLVTLVETGIFNSTGDWLNSSDLSFERQKSTYEYAGVPIGHLAPQGVSTIVDTSTTETVEAYLAILSDLFINNQKLARFVPYSNSPGAYKAAHDASMLVNHCIFKQNNGWEILESWMKSALLWKNGLLRWDYVEDYDYEYIEFERIDQMQLDQILSDETIEIIGDLQYENEAVDVDPLALMEGGQPDMQMSYIDVRLRKKVNKSRVKLETIPPENFRISRDASCIESADFVGISNIYTRSEIRKLWPEVAEEIGEDDWSSLSDDDVFNVNGYNQDVAARKIITGQNYTEGHYGRDEALEASREVQVIECWIRVDRDGDGIAELKHVIMAGKHILEETDVEMVPIAVLSPINIPHEFYGLSIADFTRSSTLASTAILRGFVENTYLTNYSPKLADPNVVDFSALQNMKPKQIIPTNGNPAAAVQAMVPETISTGTVPLLEHLQMIKEQATGMSKAAQGLNDTLYVSGNSEQKLAAVQSASQKRIQHIARRFAETGFRRLCMGLYKTMRKCMNESVSCQIGYQFADVVPSELPYDLNCEVFVDIGENSNMNKIQKLKTIGQEVIPALKENNAAAVIKPEAAAVLATQILEAMGVDSNDFLHDYTTPEFKEEAKKAMEQQGKTQQQQQQMAQRKEAADIALQEANVKFTNSQAQNTSDDNARQLAISIDKHYQEWADLTVKATKEGAQLPEHPNIEQIMQQAAQLMKEMPGAKGVPENSMEQKKKGGPQAGQPQGGPPGQPPQQFKGGQ